jgi:hypothetical protein
MIAGIVPVNFTPQMLNRTKLYDAAIQSSVVPGFAASGKVHFVDQYHSFVDASGNPILLRQPDTVHPDFDGYRLMADNWSAAMLAVPEPGGLTLVGIGLAASGRRWRSRSMPPSQYQ